MRDIFEFALAPEAFARVSIHQGRLAIPAATRTLIQLLSGAAFAAMGAMIPLAWGHENVPASFVLFAGVAAIACGIGASVIQLKAVQRAYRGSTYAARPRALRIEEGGLRIASEHSEVWHEWPEIESASLHGDVLVIKLDRIYFHVLPISAFESKAEAESLVALLNERARASRVEGAAATPPMESMAEGAPQAAAPHDSKLAAVGRSIVDALRLCLFLPVKEGRPSASWGAIFLLMAANALWPTLVALPGIGLKGEFNVFELGEALVQIPLILLASIAAAYAIGRKDEVPRILAAGLLIAIVIDIAQWASASITLFWAFWLFPAWLILAMGTYAARQVEPGMRRLGALVACLVFLVPLSMMFRERNLWLTPFDSASLSSNDSADSAGTEAVFYRQPGLLEQSLEAIRPGRKGVIDVFFVGVAGYADQEVFRREVDATTQLMEERFGAEGHSIRLVNNRGTLHDLPLASKTSLRAALTRIASMMDKEEDVLVLFMTSHGSAKHVFTLQLPPMQFENIDPPTVRALLDESGIRNRVVIVSACYSGGFTKSLEDANTLIVTAAAANKTSFGCSSEAEWTYFGKAYIDEALRTTRSFTKAFAVAKPLIVEREAKVRGAEVSDPQMSLGTHIAAKLEALERQLEGQDAVTATPGPVAAKATAVRSKYDEYVDIFLTDGYLEEMQKTCRISMAQSSPEATLRKRPAAFWGMEKSPEHWKRIKDAWASYTERFCTDANDKMLLRDTYAQKVRSVVGEKELDAALEFMRTDRGARWYRAEQEASRQQTLELARRQNDLGERLYRVYLDTESATLESYRASRK